jgi:hypothetical protein
MRKTILAFAVAILSILGVGIATSGVADASYPVGTVITFPNVLAPNGTVSCWENQLDVTTSRIDCVKYAFSGAVVQTWQGTMPGWCKGLVLAPGNASTPARLLVAHKFWAEEVPNANQAGGHGGCTPAFNQSGSQAWAKTNVTPAGCTGTLSCTVNLGILAGGSWWGPNTAQHPVSRIQMTGAMGIAWPHGMTYGTYIYFG